MSILQMVRNVLQKLIDDIDCGNSNASEEELIEILKTLNQISRVEHKLSKYQACKYLGISRATFDNLVRDGKIPEGQKEQGFKEKFWVKRDLKEYKDSLK